MADDVISRLRAAGDRDLAELLLKDPEVRRAIESLEKDGGPAGARLQLLGSSIRLTPAMAPDIHATLESCREALGIASPIESYVYPGAMFNAAAVKPEGGRVLVIFSSSLLEAFAPDELRFVAGHELGHHLFDHLRIPVASLLGGEWQFSPGLVLQMFAWQRYAEISSDRAGVYCAGGLDPAASALFKLASGLKGGRVAVHLDQFMAQVGDLREETERIGRETRTPRSDWFSTHPFSPLRLKAAALFAASELMKTGGTPRAVLEDQVQDLMTVMRPSYLQEKTGPAELMRRLLFAAGVAIANSSGSINEDEIAALEKLLGPGSIPFEVKPDVILADLPERIEAVRKDVPPLRRVQVLRDLCVIARADGRTEEAEMKVIRDIAEAIGVDEEMVECIASPAGSCGAAGDPDPPRPRRRKARSAG